MIIRRFLAVERFLLSGACAMGKKYIKSGSIQRGIQMIKRHPVKSIILAVIIVIAIVLGVTALVGAAAEGRRNDSVSEQLSLGIHYLEEMDYEAAIVCFNQVISIDDKNVAAYMGITLGYEGLGDTDAAYRTLENGIMATDNDVLERMSHEMQEGRKLAEIYSFSEPENTLSIAENPCNTLELLGSYYYQWDFNACAKMFGFDYESYADKTVNLGDYEGFHLNFDATGENVKFSMTNNDFTNSYRLLNATQMQIFQIDGNNVAAGSLALKEIKCNLALGTSYEDVLASLGMENLEPEENVYYFMDSSLGKVGSIEWCDGAERKLCLFLVGDEQLCVQYTFENEKLLGIKYGCGLPDNLRSKALNWVGGILQ